MSWVAVAAVGGSLVSGLLGSRSAGRAADAQVGANQQAIEEQRRQFNAIMDMTAPQRDVSNQALNVLAQMFGLPGSQGSVATTEGPMSLDPLRQAGGMGATRMPGQRVMGQANSIADLMTPGAGGIDALLPGGPTSPNAGAGGRLAEPFSLDNIPGTQFLIDETMRNITNAGSQSPGGNVLAALGDRVSGIAGDRVFNSLFQLAGFGPQAASTAAGSAMNTGSNIGDLLNSSGVANASGIMGQGNAWNNSINNLMMWQLLGGRQGNSAPPTTPTYMWP